MAITYRTTGDWGPGKGAALTAAEVDENFWTLMGLITDLQENPPEPNQIANFSLTGRELTVTMDDGTEFGPYLIPVTAFRDRGEWANATAYLAFDLFRVPGQGLFMVLSPHTTHATEPFDPEAVDEDLNPIYKLMLASIDQEEFGLAFSWIGAIPSDESVMFCFVAEQTISIPAGNSNLGEVDATAKLGVAVDTTSLAFGLWKNGVQFGTIYFLEGEGVEGDGTQLGNFVIDDDTTLNEGDFFTVTAPDVVDPAADLFAINMKWTRPLS